jgi:RND family efflux transporter MFP subunit
MTELTGQSRYAADRDTSGQPTLRPIPQGSRFMLRKLLPFALLVPIVLVGCHRPKSQSDDGKPPEVMVSTPVKDTIVNYAVFTGRTQSVNRVDLESRVTGFLDKVYVGREDELQDGQPPPIREGDDVKKGQVLFVLQEKPFRDAMTQAEKNYEQLVTQRDFNKRNAERLANSGVGTSPADVDNAETAYHTSESQVSAARAAVEIAKQNLEWATIRAPFDGRIGKRLVDRGNDIKADTTVLATIEQVNPLYAYFDVDERTTLRLGSLLVNGKVPANAAEKFPLTLGLANERPEAFSHKGVLKFADNRVDPSTGTLRMWGLFENPRLDLKSGMFVRVRMGLGGPQPTLFIAETALNSDQGKMYVFVVDEDDKIVYTPVETGQRKDGLIAVTGLKGNEHVVVNGLQRVRSQMVVTPHEVPMPRATEEGS